MRKMSKTIRMKKITLKKKMFMIVMLKMVKKKEILLNTNNTVSNCKNYYKPCFPIINFSLKLLQNCFTFS